MACIRFEDRLEGISNYLPWKVRMIALLKENRLWYYVDIVINVPQNNVVALDAYKVKQTKEKRFLLDGVKDALIPHLSEKQRTH